MYYLMIKTIDQTGMKYLCKRKKNATDPMDHIKYMGSGVLWRKILKKHPEYTISTKVLGCYKEQELKKMGLYYSELYNIVDNPQWANLVEECGAGGDTSKTDAYCLAMKNRRGKQSWAKGSRTAHNPATGKIIRLQDTCELPDGFEWGNIKGKSYGPRGKVVYHNEREVVYLHPNETPPLGYVKGHLRDGSTKNRIGIYNPTTMQKRYISKSEEIPKGWVKGIPPTTGKTVVTPHKLYYSIKQCCDDLKITRYELNKKISSTEGWYYK